MPAYTFQADEISCQGCANAITRAIHGIDSGARVTVDVATRRIEVESALPAEEIRQAIEDAGYDARAYEAGT